MSNNNKSYNSGLLVSTTLPLARARAELRVLEGQVTCARLIPAGDGAYATGHGLPLVYFLVCRDHVCLHPQVISEFLSLFTVLGVSVHGNFFLRSVVPGFFEYEEGLKRLPILYLLGLLAHILVAAPALQLLLSRARAGAPSG